MTRHLVAASNLLSGLGSSSDLANFLNLSHEGAYPLILIPVWIGSNISGFYHNAANKQSYACPISQIDNDAPNDLINCTRSATDAGVG